MATRLFLALNGEDVRVPIPKTGDEFVRAVAQGQLALTQIAATLAGWARPQPG